MRSREKSGSRLHAHLRAAFGRSRSRSPTSEGVRPASTEVHSPSVPSLLPPPEATRNTTIAKPPEDADSHVSQIPETLTIPVPPLGTPPTPATSSLTPTSSGSSTIGRRDLWKEAYDTLSKATMSKLDRLAGRPLLSTKISHELDDLMNLMEDKRKKCDEETWKCEVGNHQIILRDYAVKVTSGLALAGDIAVEFVPGPAKLVWPLLKGAMSSIVTNYEEQMGALLMCSERIVRVVNIGRAYEQVHEYNGMPSEAVVQLQDDLVRLYQTALEILADTENLLAKGTCRRTMHAILFPHQTSGLFSTLADRETTIDQVAQACNAQSIGMIHAPVARIDEGFQAFFQQKDWETAIEILDWISKVDYHAQHNSISKGVGAGTGATHPTR